MGKVFLYREKVVIQTKPMSAELLKNESERILWQAYPAWGQFSWLYFFSFWTALRGLVFVRADMPGWGIWIVGAGLLLGVAAILRYWAQYALTSQQVIIRNGYSGKIFQCASYDMIQAVEIMQGPLARFLGIGTVVIQCHDPIQTIQFCGVKDPGIVETKLRALLPSSSPIFSQAR